MPAAEQLLPRFRAAHTQVLGVSVDSVYSHADWAKELGGISFPLLSDFHPKGAVAAAYGLYLEDRGITDRATVIVDAGGTVRYVESVTPSGERDIGALAGICEEIDRKYGQSLPPIPEPPGLQDAVLYVRSNCGASRAALIARANLHLEKCLPVRNVSEESEALDGLREASGGEQAPCLVVAGRPILEGAAIIRYLAERTTDVGA